MTENNSISQSSDTEISFDTTSGFSLEEQQEILDSINSLTGEARLVADSAPLVSKKRGILFPILVNGGALLVLALGFFGISFFFSQGEEELRQGSSPLGHTERLLIQEIRRETNQQLSEKEGQISAALDRLSAADAEYRSLQDSLETLTEAQQERAAFLLGQLDDYRQAITELQRESAQILEDSRRREGALRVQGREEDSDFEGIAPPVEITMALEELRSLTAEQDQAFLFEDQMGAYFLMANDLIFSGLLEEASAATGTMRLFLDSPAFRNNRTIQSRRQTHLAAIGAMETAIADSLRLRSGLGGTLEEETTLEELQQRYLLLEQESARTLAALTGQSDELRQLREEAAQREAETAALESTIGNLETQVNANTAVLYQTQADLETQRQANIALINEKDELQREYDDFRNAVRGLVTD